MRQEVELAKEEIRVEAKHASKAGKTFAGAAASGLYAGFALVITLGLLIAEFVPAWVGFLIVTVALGFIATVLAKKGQDEFQRVDPVLHDTITTLEEDAQWLSEQRN